MYKIGRCNTLFNQNNQCKENILGLFFSTFSKYVGFCSNRPLLPFLLANQDYKPTLYIIWKNFARANGFIVAVLRTKINATFDPKFNSTSTKLEKIGHYKSAGLIIIHDIRISSVIIKIFSFNLN